MTSVTINAQSSNLQILDDPLMTLDEFAPIAPATIRESGSHCSSFLQAIQRNWARAKRLYNGYENVRQFALDLSLDLLQSTVNQRPRA